MNPFSSPFPKAAPPADVLVLCDVAALAPAEQLLLSSLQGLANRGRPQLYLLFNEAESRWPERLKTRGLVRELRVCDDWRALLDRFSDVFRGLIVTDPACPASVNVATMLAGLEEGLIVSPELLAGFSEQWPILIDLRGRWARKIDAYEWAWQELGPRLRQDCLAIRYPEDVRGRDYLVQFRLFTFWISGEVDGRQPGSSAVAETAFAERLLQQLPANCPILGYPYAGEGIGPGEGGGVALFTRHGKYVVCDCPNLSVHSGVPAPIFRRRPAPEVALDPTKVYLGFIISDGDNLNCWDSAHMPLWRCAARGRVPLGWNVMPACFDLIPDVLAYYYETASEHDGFIACGGGLGYANPYLYASQSADPDQALADYLAQTAVRLGALDLDILNPYHLGYAIDHQNVAEFLPLGRGYRNAQAILQRYAEHLPGVRGFLPDYARTPGMTYETAAYCLPVADRRIPVLHALTEHFWPSHGKPGDIAARVEELRRLTAGVRPAFVNAFTVNWCFDPDDIAEVMRQLGPDFVAVRPEQLLALFAAHTGPDRAR